MMKVRARVVLAGLAIAPGINRSFDKLIYGATQLQFSLRRKGHSLSCQSRGNNTVEHIDPTVDAFENIDRGAHAHEITREGIRQMLGDESRHLVALTMSFADGQAANGEAIKGELA